MKLTKSQRLKCYKLVLSRLQGGLNAVCLLLQDACLDISGIYPFQNEIPELFPEFGRQKPNNNFTKTHSIWWPDNTKGWKTRISVLEKCIRETAPKKRKKPSK